MRNGRIQASYIADNGCRYYATHTYDTRLDAEGWLANERKLIELGEWTPPEGRAATKAIASVTVREYADRWLAERDLAPKTRALYRELLDSRVLPVLGDEMVRAVTPASVRAWWVGLGKKTPTRNTHAYQLLKAIFNTAREDRAVAENPCQIKTAGRPPKPRDVQALAPAELEKVAEAVPETYRAAVPVAAWCGLRFGELIEQQVGDWSTEDRRGYSRCDRAAACRRDSPGAHEGAHGPGTGGVRVHDDARAAIVHDGVY
jgi:integrase